MPQRNRGEITDGHLLHTREGRGPTENFAQERSLLRGGSIDVGGRIIGDGQPGANRHDVLRIEAEMHLQQIPETAQQQARGDHQHEG